MAQFDRTKKLISYVYSPTDPASEDAIRLQVDNSIQEIADILYSQDAGKGASQVGINGLAYATVQDLAQVVSDSGTGTAPPADSVGLNQQATTVKTGLLADLATTDKTNFVGAVNEVLGRVYENSKSIAELLMIADIDSKVFSPNLNKFYTDFTNTMDYSMGTVDYTKQQHSGTLNAGSSSANVTSSTGFLAGQEISIQTATTYEDIILLSVVGNTLNFKTNTTLTHVNPIIYRSVVVYEQPIPTNSVFGLHFDSAMTPFVGSLTPDADTGTYDTTNKVFGTASKAYNASQATTYLDSSVFDVGSSNFYIEFRVKKAANGVLYYILGQGNNSAVNTSFLFSSSTGNKFSFGLSDGANIISVENSTVITDTNFHHIRAGRSGNNIYIAVDGTVSAPTSFTATAFNSTNKFAIGQWGEVTTNRFSGNVDEFLFVKGTPMNTTNFTVPTLAYGVSDKLKSVVRMNIAPYESINDVACWLTKTELAGFTSDGYLSVVGTSADESYTVLTESTTDLGSTEEVQMIGSVATPNTKATLKIILNRANATDNVSVTKLLGGVS